MHENTQITAKQEQAIILLLQGKTILGTAEELKVNESTIRRWQKEAPFQQAYLDARKHVLEDSFTNLQLKFNKAVETLDKHLDAEKTIPRDQIKAAEVIVEKTIQISHLLERIAELEAEVTAFKQQQEQEHQFVVKFDLRALTQEERDILRTLDATITARQQQSDL